MRFCCGHTCRCWHWATGHCCARAQQKIRANCHRLLQPKDMSWKSVKIQRQASFASDFLFWVHPDLSVTARDKVSAAEFTIYLVSKTEDHLFCHLATCCKTLQTLIAGVSQQHCRYCLFQAAFTPRLGGVYERQQHDAWNSARWGIAGLLVQRTETHGETETQI